MPMLQQEQGEMRLTTLPFRQALHEKYVVLQQKACLASGSPPAAIGVVPSESGFQPIASVHRIRRFFADLRSDSVSCTVRSNTVSATAEAFRRHYCRVIAPAAAFHNGSSVLRGWQEKQVFYCRTRSVDLHLFETGNSSALEGRHRSHSKPHGRLPGAAPLPTAALDSSQLMDKEALISLAARESNGQDRRDPPPPPQDSGCGGRGGRGTGEGKGHPGQPHEFATLLATREDVDAAVRTRRPLEKSPDLSHSYAQRPPRAGDDSGGDEV